MKKVAGASIYTKRGDGGQTSLGNGRRVPKSHGTLEVLGNLDELTSQLGLAKANLPSGETDLLEQIETLQRDLITLMGELAGAPRSGHGITAASIEAMEARIDQYSPCFSQLHTFVLPGGTVASAHLDVARTIARRAERSLGKAGLPLAVHQRYMNRLSDYVYAMARYLDFREGIARQVAAGVQGRLPKGGSKEAVAMECGQSVSLAQATRLLEELEREALRQGLKLVMAVAGASGRPVAVHVMDDAFIASYDLAVNKAFTAVSLKMPTKDLEELCKPGGSLYGLQNTNDGKIVIFGGGVPLVRGGTVIGGLGVSGSSAENDTRMAEIGERLFNQVYPQGN